LLALPIAAIGHDLCGNDGPRTGTNSAKLLDVEEELGMAIAAKTIGRVLVAGLIAVSLVALPGPAKDPQNVPHCHLVGG
jgi:hypothetical protein